MYVLYCIVTAMIRGFTKLFKVCPGAFRKEKGGLVYGRQYLYTHPTPPVNDFHTWKEILRRILHLNRTCILENQI